MRNGWILLQLALLQREERRRSSGWSAGCRCGVQLSARSVVRYKLAGLICRSFPTPGCRAPIIHRRVAHRGVARPKSAR